MQIFYKAIETPFQYPFSISGNRTKTVQPALIVGLQLGNVMGYGEAPAITYYNITVQQMIDDIEKYRKVLEKFAFTQPQRWWHFLHHLLPNNPFLVAALDMAGWDLFGKLHRKPLYQLFNTTWQNTICTDYTIGIDSAEKMIEKINQNPYPIYKIKVGFDGDVELIKNIRQHTKAIIRLDANGGWTLDQAIEKINQLKDCTIELIEQPLPKDEWDNMLLLKQQSPIPLFADESCVSSKDVARCKNYFHGINIKLTKCSGITPALQMIQEAKTLGLQVMMGCMNETEIGSAAIAHFIPQLQYVDCDGPLLLQSNIASGLQYQQAIIKPSETAGLGITLNEPLCTI